MCITHCNIRSIILRCGGHATGRGSFWLTQGSIGSTRIIPNPIFPGSPGTLLKSVLGFTHPPCAFCGHPLRVVGDGFRNDPPVERRGAGDRPAPKRATTNGFISI